MAWVNLFIDWKSNWRIFAKRRSRRCQTKVKPWRYRVIRSYWKLALHQLISCTTLYYKNLVLFTWHLHQLCLLISTVTKTVPKTRKYFLQCKWLKPSSHVRFWPWFGCLRQILEIIKEFYNPRLKSWLDMFTDSQIIAISIKFSLQWNSGSLRSVRLFPAVWLRYKRQTKNQLDHWADPATTKPLVEILNNFWMVLLLRHVISKINT